MAVRILRPLVALNIVAEKGHEQYVATPISKALDETPTLQGACKFFWGEGTTSLAQMPAYFAERKYQGLDTPSGIFNFARGTDEGIFSWLNRHPYRLDNFNICMGSIRLNRKHWLDFFPVEQILLDGFSGDKESPLLVDVAGGRGYDVGNFKARFPNHPGKLYLQETIAEIKDLDREIVVEEYDFLTPQTVKGGRCDPHNMVTRL